MGLTVTQLSFDFGGSNPSPPTHIFITHISCCGSSSVDRASAFQAEGREFEPRLPLTGFDSIFAVGAFFVRVWILFAGIEHLVEVRDDEVGRNAF